jgi:hypothetical protein
MKSKLFLATFFGIFLFSLLGFAQVTFAQSEITEPTNVNIEVKFVNKSLHPKKYVFISYQPSTPGNGTQSVVLAPGLGKKLTFEIGTKIYIANSEQVDYVMSGQQLTGRTDKPFCIITNKPKQVYTLPK